MPDLRRHPGRGDGEPTRSAGHVRVHVDHVGPVSERRVGIADRLEPLRDGHALAGQRRLAHLERRRLEQAPVRRDEVAGIERHDVAGHETLRRQLDEPAVAAHARLDDHHLLERSDCFGRLPLLAKPEHRVEERQEQDHEAGAELVQRPDAANACDEQDDLHRVVVLTDEHAPARLGLGRREHVRTVRLQPHLGLRLRQTAGRVDVQVLGDLLGRQRVPMLVRRCLWSRDVYGRRHRLALSFCVGTAARALGRGIAVTRPSSAGRPHSASSHAGERSRASSTRGVGPPSGRR